MLYSVKKVIKRNCSKKSWKAHIFLLSRFQNTFGLLRGIGLLLKFKLRSIDNIQLPGVKFPISLRPDTSDIQTFNQIFLDSSYDFRFTQKPKLIIDAGANIGLFSIKMKNAYPDATIICLEPDKDNFQKLAANLGKYEGIYLENCALWGTNTLGVIHDKYNLGKWGMVAEEKIGGDVPFVTIPYLLNKYEVSEIDILKIDIETSEKSVFNAKADDWLPKVKIVIIELHDWLEPGCASAFFKTVNNTLKDYTYLVKGEYTVIINTITQ